jgi:hypothetical protein
VTAGPHAWSSASDSAKVRSQLLATARNVLWIAAVAAKLTDGSGRAATRAAVQSKRAAIRHANEYVDVVLAPADDTIRAYPPPPPRSRQTTWSARVP